MARPFPVQNKFHGFLHNKFGVIARPRHDRRSQMLCEHGIIIDRRCRRPVTPWSPTFASRSENLSRNFAGSCIRICLKWRPT